MLDGLMGRGFSVKCKSLIKTTRTRIEVVRRRAEAKQRFLKEDLAKLLSNGLDINAYGRTEEFIAGMNLLSCYDFVEQSCEYIVKQLSKMQKQGECPEECREAVASLMFAAARFSDLPELRDLRDIFQQRYGSCLEAFVNQKFVEKLSSRTPATEKRLQVLQDIASEFSIQWDSKGFERRMATPSVVAKVDVKNPEIVKQKPGLLNEKGRIQSYGEGNIRRRDEVDHQITGRNEAIEHREKPQLKKGGSSSQGDDTVLHERRTLTKNKLSYPPIEKGDTELNEGRSNSSSSSHGKMLDNNVHAGNMRPSNCVHNTRKGESAEALVSEKKTENALKSIRKGPEEGSDRLKSSCGYALPPPYVKSKDNIPRPPYVKQTEDKHRHSRGSKHHGASDLDEHSIDPASYKRSNITGITGRPQNEQDNHLDREEQLVAPPKVKNYGHGKELDCHDEKIPLPKPRSIQKKQQKSSSSSLNAADTLEGGAVNRSSNNRRKDHSRKGLKILFDEEHHHTKDDEERMMDKLLIHYSKKPSSYDAGKLRKLPSHQKIADIGESSHDDGKCDVFPPPPRSVSLPHDHTASPEKKKVFARANSFQPDNQARHVHPKLPDYDDLAARFAALKGR